MRGSIVAAILFVFAALAGTAYAQPAPEHPPVVVELYTSQGCSSCPRANRLLGEFSREHNILALTFAVGYWDYLGWADTYAQPEFSDRQRAYSRTLRFRGPYTPQLVFDGVRQVSAADWDESRAALDAVQAMSKPEGAPSLSILRLPNNDVRVTIGQGARLANGADIWLISYEPGPLTVLITRGENAGRRVPHYNLVRRVARVGSWNGGATWFERNRCTPQCAVLVQEPRGGRIIAVAYTRRD